jgi:hypothetical protein
VKDAGSAKRWLIAAMSKTTFKLTAICRCGIIPAAVWFSENMITAAGIVMMRLNKQKKNKGAAMTDLEKCIDEMTYFAYNEYMLQTLYDCMYSAKHRVQPTEELIEDIDAMIYETFNDHVMSDGFSYIKSSLMSIR